MANTMQNDPHMGAAEFHQLAVEARRDAAALRQKDHLRVDEHPKPTMQQANKALERLPATHRKSVSSMEKPQMSKGPRQISSDA